MLKTLAVSVLRDAERASGAAKRRRERRLRSWWRHERQTVAMELAAALHHSRDGGRETYYGLRAPKTASSGGRRPGVLKEPEPPNVVDRVLRRTVDHIVDAVPGLPALDVLVPQMVENVADTLLRILDFPIADQVIEVPKISYSPCPSRSGVPEPQFAEQLVEVPTVLSPTRIAVQIAEQIVGIPVPHGFGGKRRLQGLLPEQSTTATASSLERISERTVEQIVDIPSSGRGLRQDSSSSTGAADEEFTGVFRTFPRGKKSARAAASPSARVPPHSSSWTPAAYEASCGSDVWWASLTPAQQAELEEARAAVRREHSSKMKRKKRRKRRTRRSLS